MSDKWPLGPEVEKAAIAGGRMLYDSSRASNFGAEWFEPAFWERRSAIEGRARGRGNTLFVRSGEYTYALRHYRRGGLVNLLSADRYWWRGEDLTRPFAEWCLTYHLYRAGLPVPAPVAARYVKRGRSYTGDLITARLEHSESLASILAAESLAFSAWIAIGRCIRRFHESGVYHADLNAHNVLLVERQTVVLLDFDRGELRKPGWWCDANLVRLRRSLEKVTIALPADRFTNDDWHSLLSGYREPAQRTVLTPDTPG
ncbi:MAG TPA: 3-deoxy-D-manno-octulosonic acid kinase [Steroidobacteraceae bacterium]|nr:3-deoxy-D-manno-octulosonic acid kinase [Steroidobacteraceae bacterium]